MSFRLFIYYCAICGGWAAFLTWGIIQATGIAAIEGHEYLKATLIAVLLGALVAGGIGFVDSLLNAVGFQRIIRVGICLGIGLFGGLVGGIIGQFLVNRKVPFFVAWILVGVGIGASIGIFDLLRAVKKGSDKRMALKKTLNGVYGGFLGGLLGGILFGLLWPNPYIPRTDLALGLVILGLCIGLMIGLAQVFLKEAWIKVAQGFRAGRELMLSKDETTIGRAESCDLGLFGDNSIERTHARIVLKDNRYLLADAETPGGTFLNNERISSLTPLKSGDVIRVGNSVIEFGERQKRT